MALFARSLQGEIPKASAGLRTFFGQHEFFIRWAFVEGTQRKSLPDISKHRLQRFDRKSSLRYSVAISSHRSDRLLRLSKFREAKLCVPEKLNVLVHRS